MRPMKFGFGQAPTRKEDLPLVTGIGRYVADHAPQGCLHAYFLRSPHAHARFRFTDLEAARAMPGVRLILTAADVTDLKPLPCFGKVPIVDAEQIVEPPYTVLATDVARHVGDAVAMIVADTLDQAKDAAEALAIDWEPLPHIVDAAQALKAGAPKVWPDRASNLAFESHLGEAHATQAAFAQAARVVALTLVNQRVVTNYMETRGVLAQYDPAQQKYTLTLGSQGSHRIRDTVTKMMNIGRDKMRVVTPDVGGGFGTKLFPFREYPLAAVAAKRTGKPVLWMADRTEHFLGDPHGRDNLTVARLALDENHKFLALDVDTIADMGAYLSFFAPFIPYNGSTLLPGVYHFPTMFIRIRGVFTNTLPVDAYRGAGRPEASYVTERLIDVAARDLSLAPDALRRKNFIKPKAMPYKTPTGRVYDSGDFAAHMKRAQDLADWSGFNKRLAASKKSGKLRGIGLATYIEACGGGDPEHVRVTLGQDGAVTVLAGSQSTGQGHQTAYAQLVAEHLDLPLDRIHVFQGDTDLIPDGTGTGGSRSIPVGGATVAGASRKLADNLKTLAADALEAGRDDLEIVEGRVRIVGTDRSVDYATLAKSSGATQELLSTTDVYRPTEATYPNGTHLCELEIDPDTGHVEIMQYIVVDDFGVTLNPEMLAGQVHGGIVQGIGQALLERALYDSDSGQLITATLTDYALPRADDVPNFTFETLNVPCKTNPLGVKGAGEAGAIGSCPAVMNAINDALWRAHRIRHIDMPATPDRVYKTLVEARREHTM